MDASQLAKKMIEWGEVQKALDELEAEIKTAVLDGGKTVNVGNVRASYRSGHKKYDYEEAYRDSNVTIGNNVIAEKFTKTKTTINWRGVCKHLGIDNVPYEQSAPSVTLKFKS